MVRTGVLLPPPYPVTLLALSLVAGDSHWIFPSESNARRWHGCLPELPVEEPAMSPQVNTSFDAGKTTTWEDINVEQMDIDCKKFAKDVRSLDKEMKS